MICPNCNCELVDGTAVCPYCGTPWPRRAVCHRHRDHARHPVRAARGACALAGIPS